MDINDSYQVSIHLSQSDGIEKKMQPIPYCKMPVFPILGAENCYAMIYLIKCDWVPFILDTTHFTARLEQQLPEFRHPKNQMISRHQDIFTEEQLHACVRLLKLARLMAFRVKTPCLYLVHQLNVILYQKHQENQSHHTGLHSIKAFLNFASFFSVHRFFLHLPSLSTTLGTKSKGMTAALRDLDRLEEGNNRNVLKFNKVLPVGRKSPCQPHRTGRPLHCSHLAHGRGSGSTTRAERAAQHKS